MQRKYIGFFLGITAFLSIFLFADLEPDAIITFGPDGIYGHPDHLLVGNVVTMAYQAMDLAAPLYYPGVNRQLLPEGLAALILPLALITLRRGLRRDDVKHRAIARWTLPIWLFVSVTGVVVYWMLYQM